MKVLCQVLDIGYEFGFVPLSSSKRDAESDGANQTLLILRSTEILKGELKCKIYSVLYLFWSELRLNNYLLTGIVSVF